MFIDSNSITRCIISIEFMILEEKLRKDELMFTIVTECSTRVFLYDGFLKTSTMREAIHLHANISYLPDNQSQQHVILHVWGYISPSLFLILLSVLDTSAMMSVS